jgi:hypothetical protein
VAFSSAISGSCVQHRSDSTFCIVGKEEHHHGHLLSARASAGRSTTLKPVTYADGGGGKDRPAQEQVDSAPEDQPFGFLEPVHDGDHDGRDVIEPFLGLVRIVGIFIVLYPEDGAESPFEMVVLIWRGDPVVGYRE